MLCLTCKYYAVPLSEEEKRQRICGGGDPFGDLSKKVCTLLKNPDFEREKLNPDNCAYYFPIFMRIR